MSWAKRETRMTKTKNAHYNSVVKLEGKRRRTRPRRRLEDNIKMDLKEVVVRM
jgi:hypothetical protein